jgi:hypothetical protein
MEKTITIIGDINVPVLDLFNKEQFVAVQVEQGSTTLIVVRKREVVLGTGDIKAFIDASESTKSN